MKEELYRLKYNKIPLIITSLWCLLILILDIKGYKLAICGNANGPYIEKTSALNRSILGLGSTYNYLYLLVILFLNMYARPYYKGIREIAVCGGVSAKKFINDRFKILGIIAVFDIVGAALISGLLMVPAYGLPEKSQISSLIIIAGKYLFFQIIAIGIFLEIFLFMTAKLDTAESFLGGAYLFIIGLNILLALRKVIPALNAIKYINPAYWISVAPEELPIWSGLGLILVWYIIFRYNRKM